MTRLTRLLIGSGVVGLAAMVACLPVAMVVGGVALILGLPLPDVPQRLGEAAIGLLFLCLGLIAAGTLLDLFAGPDDCG